MDGSAHPASITFVVIHNDGCIRVRIEDEHASLVVDNITDSGVVVRALNKASAFGAVRGTLFTGEVINEQLAWMHAMRARTGTTWLGGIVTYLGDGEDGPMFRIDFDSLPIVTV